jgi:hypothetical protein
LLPREITYVWPNVEGALVNHDVFVFWGRSVFRLRHELARRLAVDVSHLAMCLPTRYGRFFPLVVDLPRNQQALIVVVVTAGTPGERPSTSYSFPLARNSYLHSSGTFPDIYTSLKNSLLKLVSSETLDNLFQLGSMTWTYIV